MTSSFEKRIQEATFPSTITEYFPDLIKPEEMPLPRVAEFQRDALHEVLSRAFEKSPFYRKKMINAGVAPQDFKDINDLKKIPFTTKDELRQDPWVRLACDKKDISLIHVSTGTTGGKEIYTLHTWKEYYLNNSIIYPELMPVTREDLCYVAMPYEMSQAGLNFHNKFIVGHQAAVVPVGKGGAYSSPEKTIRLMRNLNPTIVVTSPSYAITLVEAAAEAQFDLTSLPLKKMWLGGEGCSNAFRKRVENLWGTTANFSYGSTECGFIGMECDNHDGYHVAQAHLFVEIIDPVTGEVLKTGETGEIVITSLLRFDTPLIRYRTQDVGYLDPNPCPCGLTLPRLHVRGRNIDQITLGGKTYSPFYLEEFLMQWTEVGNWYEFVVKKGDNDGLKIRIEPAVGIDPSPELAQKLARSLESRLGIPCELEFISRLPRTMAKATRVVYR